MSRREVEEWFWQVGGDLQKLHDEMTRIRPGLAAGKMWEPRVDVLEDDSRFLLRAEIAGVHGDDIGLLYVPERHAILIRGLRREEGYASEEQVKFHQLEIFYGPFEREVKLPDVPIRADQIRAQYRGGFLLISVPKQERLSIHRTTITIKKI